MSIRLEIVAANFEELMSIVGGLNGPVPATTGRRTRTAKAEPGAALPETGNGALPPGMDAPQANNDMFDDPPPPATKPPMTPTAATPQPMTQEQFLAAMRGLLGKGKDDAVRAKVAAMGFAKVRDVPLDKMAEVYAAAQQV